MRINSIRSIFAEGGTIQDEEGIHSHFFNHFRNIFDKTNTFRLGMRCDSWSNTSNLTGLEAEFQDEEIEGQFGTSIGTKHRHLMDSFCFFHQFWDVSENKRPS